MREGAKCMRMKKLRLVNKGVPKEDREEGIRKNSVRESIRRVIKEYRRKVRRDMEERAENELTKRHRKES